MNRPSMHPAIVGCLLLVVAAAATGYALGGAVGLLSAVFWCAVGVTLYVYAGYPLLLAMLRPWMERPLHRAAFEPSVCLLVAANDEEAVIGAKLENALSLDYPRDRLEVLVASDGSVDRTNAIVAGFADHGVRLLALPERRGKMTAINAAMAHTTADIVVLSDANVFLERDALRALVAPFADPAVGVTTGDVRLVGERAALGWSEDLYYRYERFIQSAESALGSTIGVDGGLFALRRRLYVPPPNDTVLDDMLIPMEIARRGARVLLVPAAVAIEEGTVSASHEFGRKSRIVAGAVQFLRGPASRVSLAQPQVLVSLLSHKILRWLTPFYGLAAWVSATLLAFEGPLYLAAATVGLVVLTLALLGTRPALRRVRIVGLCYYLCLVQLGAAVGLVRGLLGLQRVAWRRFARREARSAS